MIFIYTIQNVYIFTLYIISNILVYGIKSMYMHDQQQIVSHNFNSFCIYLSNDT